MTVTDLVSEQSYRRLALRDPDGRWELHRGRLREKPAMSIEHNDLMFEVGHMLRLQLDRAEFRVRVDAPRLRRWPENYYLPDVAAVPAEFDLALRRRPGTLDAYAEPLPLVVEVCSPSTGDHEMNEKPAEYQQRGDLEIWRLHPYERTLTPWRRRPDGTYGETVYRGGVVQPMALPGATIDLDILFNL